jgi:glycosyltransferase involved in cell wall biosynthesis
MEGVDHISPLKVLMTADTVGGVWTYSMELCRALSEFDIHFHLVTLGAEMQPWQAKEVGELDNVTVHETGFKLEWMDDPWNDVEESGAYLLTLQKAVQADIVHLNGYAHAALDWNVPVISVAHSDVYSWFRAVKKENAPAGWGIYFDKVRNGLSQANHVVAPSRAMLAELNAIYEFGNNQSVIYNARGNEHFSIGKKDKTVLCMGRVWDEAKNVQLLVNAAPKICYPIRIAGENQFERNVTDVEESNVTSLGKLGSLQIAKELSTAAVYVLPAKYEPFGLSVLEAALSGCALILGDIPSLREIWLDNAIYVDTDNSDELAEVVNALMKDEERLNQAAEKARKRAQEFSIERLGSQYASLYQQLVSSFDLARRKIL